MSCGPYSISVARRARDFPWLQSASARINQDLRLLRITHVCSAWRQLALETPALWSNISIYLADRYWGPHDKTLSSARQWFDRAQDMRRSLFIGFDVASYFHDASYFRDDSYFHDSWEQLLEFMAQYRLEELDLVYPKVNHVALKLPDRLSNAYI